MSDHDAHRAEHDGRDGPLSRAERRAAARAEREREAARRRAGLDDEGRRRSLRIMGEYRSEVDAAEAALVPARPNLMFSLGVAGGAAGLFVLLSFALFHPGGILANDVVIASAVALIVAGAGIWAALKARWYTSLRCRRVTVVAVAAAVLLAVVGVATQTEIDGRPVLRGSDQAAAIKDVRELKSALDELVTTDELLALPLDQARVRKDEFGEQAVALEEIVEKWGQREVGSFDNPSLAEAARATVQAADAGIGALAGVQDNVLQFDQAAADQVLALRGDLVSEALRGGQLLRIGAEDAGVSAVLDAPVRE